MERDDSLTDTAVEYVNAKTYVFSDSVPCLGGISTEQDKKHRNARSNRYWKHVTSISVGLTTLKILKEMQKMMTSELQCEPKQFKGRIIFMSMYNDIGWSEQGYKETCVANAQRVTEYGRRFQR